MRQLGPVAPASRGSALISRHQVVGVMDSKNERESRPEELVIPLWEEVGPSCPMDKERQRNPPHEKMVRLWLESEK